MVWCGVTVNSTEDSGLRGPQILVKGGKGTRLKETNTNSVRDMDSKSRVRGQD